jgi:hypothetical protein
MSGGVIYGSEEGDDKTNAAGRSGAAIRKNGGIVKPANLVTGSVRDTTIDMR